MKLEPHDVQFFETPEQLRDWFDANHATADDLWLGCYKKATGRPSVDWSRSVDEALCVGWIDSIRVGISPEASAQRFTPRRKGSNWSAINVAKIASLTAEGRMRPAGLAAFEARTAAKAGVYSYEREAAALSPEEEARFRANAAAWADWQKRSPSYRKTIVHWVNDAKQAATRERRMDALIAQFRRWSARRTDALGQDRQVTDIELALVDRLAIALDRLRSLDLGDTFDPRAAGAIVDAGLHRLMVPTAAGGLGGSMGDAVEVLTAIGAVDGSTALGLAMQVHVVGAFRDAPGVPEAIRDAVFAAIVRDGALVNNAATEDGGGSPARGAIPGTLARLDDDGTWRLTGEKTWTTWLPNLTLAFVTARLDGAAEPAEVGTFLVDLASIGVERLPGFEAMGMRGSASGRLVLDGAIGTLVLRRRADAPDLRGPITGAWFATAIAATYLGVGEGAREAVARWALERRPGDGRTSVAEVPSVQLRLGRMDANLRAARIVLLAAARAYDETTVTDDLALAKLVCTRAAVTATDEALRIAGGPGFLAGRLERAFRDARAGLINPPLEDVALTGFARAVLDRQRSDSM